MVHIRKKLNLGNVAGLLENAIRWASSQIAGQFYCDFMSHLENLFYQASTEHLQDLFLEATVSLAACDIGDSPIQMRVVRPIEKTDLAPIYKNPALVRMALVDQE